MRTKHEVVLETEPESRPYATVHSARVVYRQHTITILWAVIGVLLAILLVFFALLRDAHSAVMNRPPWIVGLTADGEPRILPPEWLRLRPEDLGKALRFFLRRWAQGHYSRTSSGLVEYQVSLLFMEPRLVSLEQKKKAKDEFLAVSQGESDPVVLRALNVTIENQARMKGRACPEDPGKRCRAIIDAKKITRSRYGEEGTEVDVKIVVEFVIVDRASPELEEENPFGFIVTDVTYSEGIR